MSVFSKVSGSPVIMSESEADIVIDQLNTSSKIEFNSKNPKRRGTATYKRYDRYKASTSIAEFLANDGTGGDFRFALMRGHVRIK